MRIVYDPEFYKKFKKLNVRIRRSFRQKLAIFLKNPTDPVLNNHPLEREYEGHRSINITADYRAVYFEDSSEEEPIAYFVGIGTHDQLYAKKQTS